MIASKKDRYVYFLYSENQEKDRKNIENKMSRVFTPGTVIINGKKKKFTEISSNKTNRYPDCKVIAEGYLSNMRYTEPSS